MAVERAAEAERSRVMAVFIGSCNLGFAGGPFALGSLADAVGYPIVFAVAGGFAFAALALFRMSPESRAPVAAAVRSPTPGPAGRR
jgi:predicted MFS family arabinose efflux permease